MRFIIVASMLCFGGSVLAAETPPMENPGTQSPAAIDYQGFSLLSDEVREYRQGRLVSKEMFFNMAKDPDTIILDTRSKQAFDQGHIDGAVHLNFSDFTEEALAKTIKSKQTRILIYCNNNFTDDVNPFEKKKLELALNIPTFINLYGYGYKNIYELRDGVSIQDPEMQIVETKQH